jgi:D-3-phosphoglycerate dehydrogenase
MAPKVLVTDYAWPSLEVERGLLREAGAELLVPETGDEVELMRLAASATAILSGWKRITPAVLDAAPDCRLVSRYGVGVDNIAVDHATTLGILVSNVPDFCYEEVSDHTMALLLALGRRLVKFANLTQQGRWNVADGRPLQRLRGQTLGLIGFGRIARALAPKAAGFGLRIIAYTPRRPVELPSIVTWTDDLERLLRESDYVSLHLPLTAATREMINASTLSWMKPTACLINTSRGALIDETALADALWAKRIAGAALDVLALEPGDPTNPLYSIDNVIITPHAAFYSETAIAELQRKAVERVVKALRGEVPPNVVNPAVLLQRNLRIGRG